MAEINALIIDDDIWMQRILSKTLKSYGFANTYLASNGFEGVGLAVEHLPELIILDILMPELSGHLTLRVLKSIKSTKQIPVIMVSALSDTENLGRAVKSGTAGFISKPFTRATVFEKLLNIFGKARMDKLALGMLDGADSRSNEEEQKNVQQIAQAIESDSGDDSQDINTGETNAPSNPKTTPKHLLKHYQDDEKRSIESIKKLLLKTRK